MSRAVPPLRFPEFDGEWKAAHAGDAFSKGKAKGAAGLPIYSVTMDRGLVPRDSLDRHMADDAEDGINLRAEPGDIVYNTMRMWQGAAGVANATCMVSPAYVILRPKKGTVPEFFNQRFANDRMLYSLWAYSYGLTSDRLRLYFDDFARIPVRIPTSAEQQKIADFLGTVDAKLEALRRKKSGLEAFKSGLIQRLFSQALRFTRDDGTEFPDWEEMRVGNIAEINPKTGPLPSEFRYIDLGSVTAGVLGDTKTFSASEAPSRAQRNLKPSDILFQMVRPYQRNNLFFSEEGHFVASTGYAQLRAKQDPGFLYQAVHTDRFVNDVLERCTGTGYPAINSNDLASITVPVPHPEEQRKIADALSALDAKIAAVAGQITHMETFKKGLLQQMFV